MNEKEKLYDTLLQLGTALREKRVHVYGVGWDLHKEKVEAVCEADKQYMDLPLTEEQKAVIERMLEKRMEANECELTLTYIAGILDGFHTCELQVSSICMWWMKRRTRLR